MAQLFGFIRQISLGRLMLLLSVMALLLALVMIFSLSSVVRDRAVHQLAREDARQTSQLVFHSLYSAMRKGWNKQDIHEVITRLNHAMPGVKINVYRGAIVAQQFGAMSGEADVIARDSQLAGVLQDGQERLLFPEGGNNIRYLYPLHAEAECLVCHTQSHLGAVHGVVDINYPINDIKVSFNYVINSLVGYTLLVMGGVFLLLYFKLRRLVVRPISELVAVIQQVTHEMDFNKRVAGGHLIIELKRLSEYFNRLLQAMQDYNARLEELSVRDSLTGLFNRRKFEEFLDYEVARAQRHHHSFSMIMIDLDDFKFINDTYGHPVGDLALKALTAMLEGELRKGDLMARLGGDEFVVILPETRTANGLQVAQKLHEVMRSKPVILPVGNVTLSASFSVVNFPEDGSSKEALLTAMDVLLYKAKRGGKDQVLSGGGEDNSAMVIFQQGEFMRRALSEDRVEAHFQPIVSVDSGDIMAFESLARIRDGDTVMVAGQFIEAASELGMVKEFDQRVFEQGLRHLPGILLKYPDAKLFCNLSAYTLRDDEWMRGIPEKLRAAGIPCCHIVLEVTEREALPDINNTRRIIEALREYGIQFALDDFGSGFSSFLYLKYLPVDYVKIEGSFVQNMVVDERDRIMVRHIHQVAQEFGMKSIAEFVEDEATARLLQEIGVCGAQGYYYGKATLPE